MSHDDFLSPYPEVKPKPPGRESEERTAGAIRSAVHDAGTAFIADTARFST
jgi:hypothetical protein